MRRMMALLREASTIILLCRPSTSPRSTSSSPQFFRRHFQRLAAAVSTRARAELHRKGRLCKWTFRGTPASEPNVHQWPLIVLYVPRSRRKLDSRYRLQVSNQTAILVQLTKQEVPMQHPCLVTTFVGDSYENKVSTPEETVPGECPAPNERA